MTQIKDGFLTYDRVRQVYEKCYRDEGPFMLDRTTVEAWIHKHTFSINQLAKHREDIVKMLLCLPAGFRMDEKAGGSVMAATERADGTMWTGEMPDVEKLVALGIGVGLIEFCTGRENWHKLPGGLPYIRIMITRFGVKIN